MPLTHEPQSWRRDDGDGSLVCSTDPKLVQLDTLNAALASDMMWWAKALPLDDLRVLVENSLCFGLYHCPNSSDDEKDTMIGFARVITDNVTFGYLTDVYVLPEYQGKGLGTWMMQCLESVLKDLPHLRRFLILTSDPGAERMYGKTLGASAMSQDVVKILQRDGAAKGEPPAS